MRSNSVTSRMSLALLVGALSLAGAACGGDDDDDESDAASENGGGDQAEVVIEGTAFPETIEVGPGETIRVVNQDGFAHTFTSEEGGYDEEVSGDDEVEVQAPDEPGDYPTVCKFHPGMEMTVTVSG